MLETLALDISYRSDTSNVVSEFYVPCLEKSVLYRRAAGYFTSNGLSLAAKGIAHLIRNGGHIRLSGELDRKIAQRRARLEELAEQTLIAATTQRVLNHSARARETLGKYREEIAKSHMVRLEELITGCFGQLHRKKRVRHTISIDRETYELRLTEEGGKRISSGELSAGERQLLAVSVLWALAQASGRRLPTVIDTPLGRLDSKHRNYLVQNYFPQASHQVILFSTDEEITPDYYRQLKPSIGREYCIEFDEVKRSSLVSEGYFSEKALAA